ncbi:MAG: HigA family addiction module antidote protein [Gammaproteobacteria bacterium]|nr:HigA family addiction module antidote protein [Gammaproteobacteria bacterium]MYG66250.1 HigA family addiction module antidote protein [Gammaproteobacteria bacterium]
MALQRKEPPIHPGIHIRQSILPTELTVKKAAEMLGVGRPALSNLLNGNAALSPEMAMRIEKGFHAEAPALLEMQARYDEFEARVHEDDIVVRAYAPAYLGITARQIASWADTIDARGQLPALLRTLVHSTGNNLTRVDFPAFDNSQRKGWDGQVISESARPWIPLGHSGWESGCGEDPRTKAEADYNNRTPKIPAKERKSMTFVFVTPRNWTGKDNWTKDKSALGQWKDVRAFDASDLEQWLEQSVPAQVRMREFLGGAGQEVTTLDQIWLEWADATEPRLPKELFLPATERHQELLENWLQAPPASALVVTAESVIEALAFLGGSLEEIEETCPGAYERAIVIRSLEAFRTISRISSNYIAIVASPEVEEALAGLQKKTHTIIVRGRNTVINKADIALDLLSHEPFRKALSVAGLEDPRINQLARESARSPTILRRRLAQVEAVKVPPWAMDDTVAQRLIPFIFPGAWDASVEADREILRCLTGSRSFEEVEQTIALLQRIDESPVWSISNHRGVVSKIDALYTAHPAFTCSDLENFLFVAEVVLSEQDPALELPKDKPWGELYDKSRQHSDALRQGLCDTLVLLAVHGNSLLGGRLGIDLEARVSDVVKSLLTPSAMSTWLSQKEHLQQYAEAAPNTFLDIVEADLDSDDPQLAVLFVREDTGIFGGCPRTGMLSALELLAWKPERLVRVTSILARFCAWKIDDNLTNSPMNALQSIFRCWMPQTAASLGERSSALERLTRKFPDVGWQVCIHQLNPVSAFGAYGNRPRWRTDAYDAGKVTTNGDAWDGQDKAAELVLHWPVHDEHMLGDLVQRLKVLSPDQRNRVWELITVWNDTGPNDDQKAALRERIRNYALTRRSRYREIDDEERDRARQAYALLEPRNPVDRHRWLFVSHWVEESGDEVEDERFDHEKREKRIACQRHVALQEIWTEAGLDGIKELCRSGDASGDASGVIGWHMAEIDTDVEQRVKFVHDMLAGESTGLRGKSEQCVSGFLERLDLPDRDTLLAGLLAHLGSDEDGCIRLLGCAPFDSGTWQHVDRLSMPLQQRYWEQVNPHWDRHDASAITKLVDELLKVNRPLAAFQAARIDWELLDSSRLMRLLTALAAGDAESSGLYPIEQYYVSRALDTLEQREDASREDLARIELLHIRNLDGSDHGIPNLEAQVSDSPAFFMHMLALGFKRNDSGEDPVEWQQQNADKRKFAENAGHALRFSVSRIPGTRVDSGIDRAELMRWLEQVRTLATKYGRADVCDRVIGRLLSCCPHGEDGIWPCEPVRGVIDDTGSQEIVTGVFMGILNNREFTSRGEGGAQDHQLAEKFRTWSRELAFDHPFTSRMLEKISDSYDHDARWWDTRDRVRERLQLL